jgi:hypothetical protein
MVVDFVPGYQFLGNDQTCHSINYYIWLIINERSIQYVLPVVKARRHFPRQTSHRFHRKLLTVKSVSNQPPSWTPSIIHILQGVLFNVYHDNINEVCSCYLSDKVRKECMKQFNQLHFEYHPQHSWFGFVLRTSGINMCLLSLNRALHYYPSNTWVMGLLTFSVCVDLYGCWAPTA